MDAKNTLKIKKSNIEIDLMVTQTQKQTYTPEEYLELEEQAEFRNEYQDGEILLMAGGTVNHNRIVRNLIRILDIEFQDRVLEVFSTDLRLWIPTTRTYTYPDVMIIEGEPIYQDNRQDIVTNPLLIVEVLSKSTQDYDRGDKFRAYRSIPSFQEYILIDQYSYHLEQYSKQAESQWLFKEYESEESILILESVECQIAFSDIYQRVNFEAESE